MTEPYFLCWDIQIPNADNSAVSKWFQRWHVKDDRTLHPLWEHSNPNWTRQISIEMITKIKETNILSGDISNQNWGNSLVLKWLKRWQNPTLFLGIFTFQLKKTVQYWNYFKDDRPQHPLWGHSNPNWKRQLSIENDHKHDKTLLYLLWHSSSNWQNLTLQLLLRHSNSNWKRQFIIEMISNMTEDYILCGDIQIPTEKDSSLSKWLQRWQKLTSFVGHLNNNKKEPVWYWNDYKDDRTMHPLSGH